MTMLEGLKNRINPATYLNKMRENPFSTFLLIVLTFTFFAVLINEKHKSIVPVPKEEGVHIFEHPECPHCQAEKKFINDVIKPKYPDINFYEYDISQKENLNLFLEYANKFGLSLMKLGTPTIFTDDDFIVGFENAEITGKKIETAVQRLKEKNAATISDEEEMRLPTALLSEDGQHIDLPIFGKIDILNTSIPILAIIIGTVDGFNPCAMWVLVYLISIIVGLNDKRKIWLLVGSFVLSSGILYFLFMTAWLNAFLLIGYLRTLSLLVGLVALYMGFMNLHEFIITKGDIQCKLIDNKTRQETMSKVRKIAHSPITWASIFAVVVLAFIVNSIEFVCSAALPAIFTYILTQANLSVLTYYMYILLYIFFFMLDDLIVFGAAAFAVNKYAGTKYLKYSTVIGGAVMILIGILLVFFPNYLH